MFEIEAVRIVSVREDLAVPDQLVLQYQEGKDQTGGGELLLKVQAH